MKKQINRVLFFFVGFFLPTQLGKHFFLPFSYLSGVRIDYLAPAIYVFDFVAILLIVFNGKDVFVSLSKRVFIIFGILTLPLFFSLSPYVSFYRYIYLLIAFGIFCVIQKNKKYILYLVAGLFLSSLFELLLSIYQLVYSHAWGGWWYWLGERSMHLSTPGIAKASFQGTEILRPYGTFSHPNSMGGFYVLLFAFIIGNKAITNTVFKHLFMIVTTVLIFLSFSKAAISTFVIVYLVYVVRKKQSCRLCTVAQLFSLPVVAAIFMLWTTDPLSSQKRIEGIVQSFSILIRHGLTGTGWGAYLVAQNTFPIKYPYFFLQPVHNIFLLITSEVGIPIMIGMSIVMSKYIKRFFSPPFILPALAVFLTGMVDHYWVTLHQNYFLIAVLFPLIEIHRVAIQK